MRLTGNGERPGLSGAPPSIDVVAQHQAVGVDEHRRRKRAQPVELQLDRGAFEKGGRIDACDHVEQAGFRLGVVGMGDELDRPGRVEQANRLRAAHRHRRMARAEADDLIALLTCQCRHESLP